MDKKLIAIGILLVLVTFAGGICCGFFLRNGNTAYAQKTTEFYGTENTVSSSDSSSAESETAISTGSQSSPSTESEDCRQDNGYNYLAIGNSITRHNITGYWWNEIGMAASDEDRDYYHIVLKHLEENNENVIGEVCNLYGWESLSHDRDGALYLLDDYLSPGLDLVTVQLGENVDDLTTFQSDFLSLLQYIKEKSPDARILVIGDFWIRENRNEIKEIAAKEAGVEFVSLDGIASNKAYYRGLGSYVYDKDGNAHIVDHEGVAIHPSDAGMKAIADRIIETLDQ